MAKHPRPAPKPKRRIAVADDARAVHGPHLIEAGPILAASVAFMRMLGRRMLWAGAHYRKRMVSYTLPALAFAGLAVWNYQPVWVYDVTVPYRSANCEVSQYADGIWRRWGVTDASQTCPAAVAQTLAWASYTTALADECDMPPRMTRLQSWKAKRQIQVIEGVPIPPIYDTYQTVAYSDETNERTAP